MESKSQIKGIIHLKGASCTSCVIGIEHMGKRLKGVYDIHIQRKDNLIILLYDGKQETLDIICDFVKSIGYEAYYTESENNFTTAVSAQS